MIQRFPRERWLILGRKEESFKEHIALSLEELVPPENFYRQLEQKLNLSFVHALVRDACDSSMGRPSIDPIVLFKLQLIMFFESIRSERQLMEMVNVNLAHRWYIGYALVEPVPNHSSLSKIRSRYGLGVFQRFFEKIVELCLLEPMSDESAMHCQSQRSSHHSLVLSSVGGSGSRLSCHRSLQESDVQTQVWVEPLFAEAKQWHQLMRFRLGGLRKVNIEGLLMSAGQNIKRLLRRRLWDKPFSPFLFSFD